MKDDRKSKRDPGGSAKDPPGATASAGRPDAAEGQPPGSGEAPAEGEAIRPASAPPGHHRRDLALYRPFRNFDCSVGEPDLDEGGVPA
jgi:hypothetical protein